MRAGNSTVAELLEGSKVFAVPLFQRQYSWDRNQWRALFRNIEEQYEYEADEIATGAAPVNHFIGSFVLSPIGSGNPQRILVVDGQQRLITISVMLAALRDMRWQRAMDVTVRRWLEDDFTKAYLTNSVLNPTPDTKFRVLPTQRDRDDFASTVTNVPGVPMGRVGEAYRYFYSELRNGDTENKEYDLDRLTNVLLTRLTLIDIRTEKGDNVHRVFQTLNSSGVRLKQIDLLRNHFFMLLPTRGEELYLDVWRDMELRLGETAMDSFFWASLVPHDRRVSRKTVFTAMQERLERNGLDQSEAAVERILRELNANSIQYLHLIDPSEEPRARVRDRLDALKAWGTDTYYPLGLALLIAERAGGLLEDDLVVCLMHIESFLVRRMLVGVPTNNLNRIFSTVTASLPQTEIEPWLRTNLTTLGKPWPDDATVQASVYSRPFMFSGQPAQRLYVLEQLEKLLRQRADKTSSHFDEPWEPRRLMPPEITKTWPITAEEGLVPDTGEEVPLEEVRSARERTAHTLGNVVLVPKSLKMVDKPFKVVREDLRQIDIMFNLDPRQSISWGPALIQERSLRLADSITTRWPGPVSREIYTAPSAQSERPILLLPEHGVTLVSDLAEFWAVDDVAARSVIAQWPPDVRSRVLQDLDELAKAEQSASAFTAPRRYMAADLSRLVEVEESANLEQSDE